MFTDGEINRQLIYTAADMRYFSALEIQNNCFEPQFFKANELILFGKNMITQQ